MTPIEQALDALRPFANLLWQNEQADGDSRVNVTCQIAVADMRRAVEAMAALEAPQVLTDELIAEIYKKEFESYPGAARSAPECPPLAIRFARAVLAAHSNKSIECEKAFKDATVYGTGVTTTHIPFAEFRTQPEKPEVKPIGTLSELRLRVALEDIIKWNRDHARDQHGDSDIAETWSCVREARSALATVQKLQAQEPPTEDDWLALAERHFASICGRAKKGWLDEALINAYAEGRRDEQEELSSVLPGSIYMDPPDGGSPSILEQLQRQAKDADRYRWLRSKDRLKILGDEPYIGVDSSHFPGLWALFEQQADSAIDAAISKTRGVHE